jgi:CxxC motif-containing protein
MRKFSICLAMLLLFSACSYHLEDFQQEQAADGGIAKGIANYLTGLAEIEDCAVEVKGGVAIVSINLADGYEYGDKELIDLKRRIVADVRRQNSGINHVAITTAADVYEKIYGVDADNPEEEQIDKKLDKNSDKEIFMDIIPKP